MDRLRDHQDAEARQVQPVRTGQGLGLLSAGNGAVTRLLQPSMMSVQRDPLPGGTAQATRPEDAMLTSTHEEVNGRSATAACAELQNRNQKYRTLTDHMRRACRETWSDELAWYANLGLAGTTMEWLSGADRTDPSRWNDVYNMWLEAASAFDAARDKGNNPGIVNEIGKASVTALAVFERAYKRDTECRAEYQRYLNKFTDTAGTVVTVSTITRDVAFATAVALAAVAWAPAVAGAVGGFGTGTLGLSGAGATAFTYAGTAATFGMGGAVGEGALQGASALGAEASAALVDLITGGQHAADNFNWETIKEQGWEGMKRGFVDGVLAPLGLAAENALASRIGAQIVKYLGPANSSLMSLVIRRALQRALASGATGSVIGALQAGVKATFDRQDLGAIGAAMAQGFVVGAAVGTVGGAAGGALEARSAHQLREAVLPELRAAVELSDIKADEAAFKRLMDQLQENPNIGTNAQLIELLPGVFKAIRDPDNIANAMADIWLEAHLLSYVAPRRAADRFGEAALVLAERAGAPVKILPRGMIYQDDTFYTDVVLSGHRFLDLAILDQTPFHGAITHLLQDAVADRALRGTGIRAEQLRRLFAGATRDGSSVNLGEQVWNTIFDPLWIGRGINQPEIVYSIIRKGLNTR